MIRRTTIAAEEEDLRTIEDDARRRGISLAAVMREVVRERAAALRAERRPRAGLGASGHGQLARESVDDEDSPVSAPFR